MLYGTALGVVRTLALDEGLEKIAAAGFTQIELICEENAIGRWRLDVPAMKRRLDALGIRAVSVHVAPPGWDADAPDATARRAALDVASHDFAASVSLGAAVAVVHPNHSSHPFTREDYAASVARSVESLAILAERARVAGLRLAVENMPDFGEPRPAGSLAELIEMIAGLGGHVGLCLDAAHAASNGLDAADEARVGASRIFAVHLQDCSALGKDEHLLPGRGIVAWPALLSALDAHAPQALRNFEIRSKPENVDSSLAAIAKLGKEWETAAT